MDKENLFAPPPEGLVFYWGGLEESTDAASCWANLNHSLIRLVFLREELKSIQEIGDIHEAFFHLQYFMENYLVRIEQLHNRTIEFMKSLTFASDAGALRDPESREEEAKKLMPKKLALRNGFLNLLSALDDDLDLKNQNINDSFFHLAYSDGQDLYDPHDLLTDLKPQSREFAETSAKMKAAIEKVVAQRLEIIGGQINLTGALLKLTDSTPK